VWSVLQYVLGLRAMGHAVHFLEPFRWASSTQRKSFELLADARYAQRVLSAAGLDGQWSFIDPDTRVSYPRPYADLVDIARSTDVLINISGLLSAVEELVQLVPIRVYVDVDPVYTQLWQEVEGVDMGLSGHTHHVTYALAAGFGGSRVPSCGVHWIRSLPPVVLRHWPVARPRRNGSVTSVGNWRSYGTIIHDGIHYGQRAHSFRPLVRLPSLSSERLVQALTIDPTDYGDIELLSDSGWVLVDPKVVAGTPQSYREFIRGSKAELGIAKSGYVVSRCGWFSDRSACYLASGRPVVAQDTGFSNFLPVGAGLFSFEGVDDAAAMLQALCEDFEWQADAARRIAEEFLDSKVVLGSLLERIGAVP